MTKMNIISQSQEIWFMMARIKQKSRVFKLIQNDEMPAA